jgi:hypothetical protein
MPISDLNQQFEDALDRFAWEEWAQMGILAATVLPRKWAQDPEALLLFSFEVGRNDPRLFDEILDWLVTNEQLVNLRRLRSLAVDPEDRALTEAVIAWLGRQKPKARFAQPVSAQPPPALRPLFLQGDFPISHPDPAFAAHGWLRPVFAGTRKSMPPKIDSPINLCFRLRLLFGLTARAELARLLLTMQASGLTSAALARSAGFTKRNVHEALASFERAGVVSVFGTGYELRYRTDRERWAAFLELPGPVEHVDWIPILLSLRRTLRWGREARRSGHSAYLLASGTRDLIERMRADLLVAGIEVPPGRRAETAPGDLLNVAGQIFEALDIA